MINPELLDSALIKSDNESKQMFIEALFSNMDYKVKNSTTREDGNVVVNVSITNIDVANIFNLVYKDIFRKTFNGEKDINISESLANILKKPNLPKKTILSQFLMEKNGDSYKIILRKENIDDIFGSYFSTATTFISSSIVFFAKNLSYRARKIKPTPNPKKLPNIDCISENPN